MTKLTALLGVSSVFALAAIIACGGDDDDVVPPAQDGGADTSLAVADSATSINDAASVTDSSADADAAVPPSPYAAVVLADSPVVFYRFQESAGATVVKNSSAGASAFDMTVTGAPQFGVASLLANPSESTDKSATFTQGSYALLSLAGAATAPVKVVGAFSIDAWVVRGPLLDGGVFAQTILSTQGGAEGWSFYMSGAGTLALACHGKSNVAGALSVPMDGKAHYVAVVFDGVDTVAYTVDDKSETLPKFAISTITYVTSTNLALARFGSSDGNYFNNPLDEVALYATALSPARLAAHYNAGL